MMRSAPCIAAAALGAFVLAASAVAAEGAGVVPIVVTVGGRSFAALVEDSATGRAFLEKLPLALDMQELNGNEKYRYGVALPTAAEYCATIAAGDLMLYGSNCLVLFYGAAGGYSYTRVGRLASTEGLAEAVGAGTATVTFEKVRLEAKASLVDGSPVFTADTNLPAGTPIALQGAERLAPGPADWRDLDPLDGDTTGRCTFFRYKATIQTTPRETP